MITWVIVKTVLALIAAAFFFYLTYLGCRGLNNAEKSGSFIINSTFFLFGTIFTALVGLCAIGYIAEYAHHSHIILCREMSDGVFADQYYQVRTEKIPENLKVLCASEGPFGITIYHWKWCRLISIEEAVNRPGFPGTGMDVIVSRNGDKAILSSGKEITLQKDIKTFTKNIAADRFWRQSHPNETEGNVDYLIWPKVCVDHPRNSEPLYGDNYYKDYAVILEYIFN
jgi:hypothetical protein